MVSLGFIVDPRIGHVNSSVEPGKCFEVNPPSVDSLPNRCVDLAI
jgi:hypothetical protein